MKRLLIINILILCILSNLSAFVCVTFDTKQKAIKALTQIDINKKYPIKGRNAMTGKIENKKGQTLTWGNIQKIYNQDKWFFKKPCKEFLVNVIDYQEKEYSENWVESIGK